MVEVALEAHHQDPRVRALGDMAGHRLGNSTPPKRAYGTGRHRKWADGANHPGCINHHTGEARDRLSNSADSANKGGPTRSRASDPSSWRHRDARKVQLPGY